MSTSKTMIEAAKEDELLLLTNHEDPAVREALARREGPLPDWVLLSLSLDASAAVRKILASRTDPLPLSVLLNLVSDSDLEVRNVFAENPSAPLLTLDKLLDEIRLAEQTQDEIERFMAAMQTKIEAADEGELIRLATHENPAVRDEVAGREAPLPDSILEILSVDSSGAVRTLVAGRVEPLPEPIAERLSTDVDFDVRETLAWRRLPLPDYVLERLATDEVDQVRRALALRPYLLPDSILLRLASDSANSVRDALAGNPSTPLRIVARMVDVARLGYQSVAKKKHQAVVEGRMGKASAQERHEFELMVSKARKERQALARAARKAEKAAPSTKI